MSNSHQGDSGICGVFLFYLTWVSYVLNKYRYTRPHVNGVSLANRDKTIFCLGSDGSQQEGNDAEAARLAVAQGLNVKLFIDDNDVTIAGHPSEYLKGYNILKTLEGHGLKVFSVQGEDLDSLWGGVCAALTHQGPVAGVYSS